MDRATALASLEEGAIVRGRSVGFGYGGLVTVVLCSQCGAKRFAQLARIPPTGLCLRCSGLRTVVAAQDSNRGRARPEQGERQRGSNNARWTGGQTIGGSGYRYVWVDRNDPLFVMANTGGYAMEHRLILARSIGRPLERWEQVHHINGNRTDNRLENLELWKSSHPSGIRQGHYHCPGCRCFEEGER